MKNSLTRYTLPLLSSSSPGEDTIPVAEPTFYGRYRKYILLLTIAILAFLISSLVLLLCSSTARSWILGLFRRKAKISNPVLSKGPILQLTGDDQAMLIWESLTNNRMTYSLLPSKSATMIQGLKLIHDDSQQPAFIYQLPTKTLGPLNVSLTDGKNKLVWEKVFNFPSKNSAKIAIIGDSQDGVAIFRKLLTQVSRENTDIFMHLGDMAQHPEENYDWQEYFFNPLQETGLISSSPFIIVMGNHDFALPSAAPYFPPPSALLGHPTGNYYAMTIAKCRIIVLDSNIPDTAQIRWLARELTSDASKQAAFRIVAVHVSPFIEFWDPKAWRGNNEEYHWPEYIRERAVPLFEQHRVDLVLSGHQHNYQRGQHNRVTYVISGGGGGRLDLERVEDWGFYNVTILKHHYLILSIQEDKIELSMKFEDGSEGDRFIINRVSSNVTLSSH